MNAGRQSWTAVLTLFSIATVIETIGISQIVAFVPLDLKTMGLPQTAIPRWVGLLNALVFLFLSRHPSELAGSLLLVGFQLGNTGVMLASIRYVTPRDRLGTAVAIFGAALSLGFAAGPTLGGLLLDHLHTPIAAVYTLSSALSMASAVMLTVGLREIVVGHVTGDGVGLASAIALVIGTAAPVGGECRRDRPRADEEVRARGLL